MCGEIMDEIALKVYRGLAIVVAIATVAIDNYKRVA